MEELLNEFAELRISALSKSMVINKFVEDVTIGPNSTICHPVSPTKPLPTIETHTKIDQKKEQKPNKTTPIKPTRRLLKKPFFQNVALSNIEKNRREKEYQSISVHSHKIENFNKQQETQRIQQWQHHHALKLKEIQYQENLILQAMQQVEVESKKELDKASLRNLGKEEDKKAYSMLIKAKAEEQQKLKLMATHIIKTIQEFNVCLREIDSLFIKNEEAKSQFQSYQMDFGKMKHVFDDLVSRLKLLKITENDLQFAQSNLINVKQLKEKVRETIKEYYSRREKEAAEKVALLKQKEAEKAAAEAKAKKAEEDAQKLKSKQSAPIAVNDLVGDKTVITYYSELQTFLQNHELSYKQLLEDQSLKQFKFDCKKAVNIPVNAISAVSSSHLLDKYTKLRTLLNGKNVPVGEYQINASQHPQGIAFCMDLLAKQFILQGDLTISSNPDAAFPYAAVIIALWNDFPLFGKLILAHFYRICPYLVPLQLHQRQGESDEEFYTKLGYNYKDGTIEKQDKFLKRMTGITRLYFAILISKPKQGQTGHPHSLKYGWMWVARTLNMEPYFDVTATVIYSFLEVAGFHMDAIYKNQFRKIIACLLANQIPRLREKDSGGPVARLEVMLQEYYKTGKFIRSSGVLSMNFW